MPDPVPPAPPAPPAGGTPPPNPPPPANTPETAKVTLPGGVIVEMPKADAEIFMAARTKEKEEREALARKAGEAAAERKAAEDRAAKEAQEKEAIRLASAGEIARAKEILTADANARLATVSGRLRDEAISSAIRRACPGLDDNAVADMKSLIAPGAAYDAESGRVTFAGPDGKPLAGGDGQPLGPDGYLAGWLKTRPHFQVATLPPPAGGGQPPTAPAAIGTIRMADVTRMTPEQAVLMRQGKLRLIE